MGGYGGVGGDGSATQGVQESSDSVVIFDAGWEGKMSKFGKLFKIGTVWGGIHQEEAAEDAGESIGGERSSYFEGH